MGASFAIIAENAIKHSRSSVILNKYSTYQVVRCLIPLLWTLIALSNNIIKRTSKVAVFLGIWMPIWIAKHLEKVFKFSPLTFVYLRLMVRRPLADNLPRAFLDLAPVSQLRLSALSNQNMTRYGPKFVALCTFVSWQLWSIKVKWLKLVQSNIMATSWRYMHQNEKKERKQMSAYASSHGWVSGTVIVPPHCETIIEIKGIWLDCSWRFF